MQLHKFIFADEPRQRWARHGSFWLLWALYFFGTNYFLQSPHNLSGLWETAAFKLRGNDVIITFCMLSIHITACYIVIGYLLPRYLLTGRYFVFFTWIVLLGLLMAGLSHLIYQVIFPNGENEFIPFARGTNSNTWWASIAAGPLNAIKIIALAITIKLSKRWWIKQKESRELEREKINAELQLLKAQIHPGFLFNVLNHIYVYALAGSPRASEMLLKLSDLLSYMLYECEGPLVSLVKEIEIMKEYMALEKIRQPETFEMEIKIRGDATNKLIAPFLLLPFIENSFQQCRSMSEKSWISLEIKVEESYYIVKLINGISPEMINQPDLYGNGLINVQKRLNLLYPGKHELRMNADGEMFLVNLKVQLDEREDHLKATESENKNWSMSPVFDHVNS